jgi:hypothetical protein
MTEPNASHQETLGKLLSENGLTLESRFYRYTMPEHLESGDAAGSHRLSANTEPSEAVIDVYAQGHLILAEHMGPGLAFAESVDNEWRGEGRTAVEVSLKDVIDQGGLMYPVESIITDRVWYMTLPAGHVAVRVVE